jgi:hypothetical protein
MPWLAVFKDGSEAVYSNHPSRNAEGWLCGDCDWDCLEKGKIFKILGRSLTWDDDPVEIKEALLYAFINSETDHNYDMGDEQDLNSPDVNEELSTSKLFLGLESEEGVALMMSECPMCSELVSFYEEDVYQFWDKGLSFEKKCPNCGNELSQQYLT